MRESLSRTLIPFHLSSPGTEETRKLAQDIDTFARTIAELVARDLESFRAGDVTITGAATNNSVTFDLEEPDTGFEVCVTVKSVTGAPAAGAYIPIGMAYTTTGFTLTLTAAPGIGTSITYSWIRVRR